MYVIGMPKKPVCIYQMPSPFVLPRNDMATRCNSSLSIRLIAKFIYYGKNQIIIEWIEYKSVNKVELFGVFGGHHSTRCCIFQRCAPVREREK